MLVQALVLRSALARAISWLLASRLVLENARFVLTLPGIRCAWRVSINLLLRVLLGVLLQAIVHCEVVQLSEVLVDTQDFLMLDRLLHFCLGCIALLLLLNEFLNFRGVQAACIAAGTLVLDVAVLNDALDLGLDVAISQILMLK